MTLRSIHFLMLSLIAILFDDNICVGQGNRIIIKGLVTEINSSIPLPFSSISVLNSQWGTVSNEAGNFELNIPPDLAKDTLGISFIGYATRLVPISELANKQNVTIGLTKETRILKEITVTDKKPNAKKIVSKALDKIHQNYISRPHHMEAFYREQVFNATEKSFNSLECVVNIEDPGIRRTDSLVQIQIKEMRKGDEYLPEMRRDTLLKSFVNKAFLGHESFNNIYWIYCKNPVRTYGYSHRYDLFLYAPLLKPGFTTKFEFEITDYWVDNGVPVYEISFKQKAEQQPEYSRAEFNATIPKKRLDDPTLNLDSLYQLAKQRRKSFAEKVQPTLGKIYVNATDFGILKLVYEDRILNFNNEWGLVSRTEMQYAKYNEKYYLKFICDINAQRNNKTDEKYKVKYLQVNTIENKNVTRSPNNVFQIGRWDDLWNIPYDYHPLFWNNSNNGFLPNFDVSKLIAKINTSILNK